MDDTHGFSSEDQSSAAGAEEHRQALGDTQERGLSHVKHIKKENCFQTDPCAMFPSKPSSRLFGRWAETATETNPLLKEALRWEGGFVDPEPLQTAAGITTRQEGSQDHGMPGGPAYGWHSSPTGI